MRESAGGNERDLPERSVVFRSAVEDEPSRRFPWPDLVSSVEIVLPCGPMIGGRPVSTALGMSAESLDPNEPLAIRLERQIWEMGVALVRLSLASILRAGEVLGDELAGNRSVGREDRRVLGALSITVLAVGGLAMLIPTAVGFLVAVIALWFGITTGIRAWGQAMRARSDGGQVEQRRIEPEEREV